MIYNNTQKDHTRKIWSLFFVDKHSRIYYQYNSHKNKYSIKHTLINLYADNKPLFGKNFRDDIRTGGELEKKYLADGTYKVKKTTSDATVAMYSTEFTLNPVSSTCVIRGNSSDAVNGGAKQNCNIECTNTQCKTQHDIWFTYLDACNANGEFEGTRCYEVFKSSTNCIDPSEGKTPAKDFLDSIKLIQKNVYSSNEEIKKKEENKTENETIKELETEYEFNLDEEEYTIFGDRKDGTHNETLPTNLDNLINLRDIQKDAIDELVDNEIEEFKRGK